MKKIIQKIGIFGALLSLSVSLFHVSAASTVEWATNAATEPLFSKISASEISITGKTSQPVPAFSYEAETTAPRTDFDSTDISFNLTIAEAKESHTDFHAMFTFRTKEPQNGIWGPANSGLSLAFEKERAVLRRWSMGAFDTEHEQQLAVSTTDGKPHQVKIKISGKTVAVSIDGKTMSVTFTTLPSTGGFQFSAYRAKVSVSGFDNTTPVTIPASSTSDKAPSTSNSTTPANSTAPSNNTSADSNKAESVNAVVSAAEQTSDSEEPSSEILESSEAEVSKTTDISSENAADASSPKEKKSGNGILIFITIAVVLVCVGGALAYYFLVYKKKQ